MIKKQIPTLILGAAVLLFAACAPQGEQVPETGGEQTPGVGTPSPSPGLPPEAILNAQQWLAEQLSVLVEQVKIVDIEQAQWPDSCLGLGQPNESCAQVITPGWRAVFEANGKTYEVRTDETGSVVRLATQEGTPGAGNSLENTHWSLVSFGSPGAEKPLVERSTVTLMLANGQAGGSGGCNSYGTEYQVDALLHHYSHLEGLLWGHIGLP